MTELEEILEIMSFDDFDEDIKLQKIEKICRDNYEKISNLYILKEYVEEDINAGNFNINNDCVAQDFYKEFLNIKS